VGTLRRIGFTLTCRKAGTHHGYIFAWKQFVCRQAAELLVTETTADGSARPRTGPDLVDGATYGTLR
jgi:hypothetical protein